MKEKLSVFYEMCAKFLKNEITIPDNLCVVTQEMAWIDVRLMMV